MRAGLSSTETGDNGTYTLSSVPTGQVKVTVAAEHYQSEQALVQVIHQQTLTLDFQLSNLLHPPHSRTIRPLA